MESLGSEQAAAKNLTRLKIVADVIIIMGSRHFSRGRVGGPSIRPVRASPSVRMTRLSRPVRCSPRSPAQQRCPAHGRQASVVQYEAPRQPTWAENCFARLARVMAWGLVVVAARPMGCREYTSRR